MQLIEFTSMLIELVTFYERKEPRQGTIELWFDKVKNIPSAPVKWITKKIEDENDAFPRNLPAAIWSTYYEWQQANPDKMLPQQFFDCPECDHGLIYATQIKENHQYRYVFGCSRCRQNKSRAYPTASRLELSEHYDLIPVGGNLNHNAPRRGNVVELVASIAARPF